jgi:hypothetical protein
MINPSQDLYLHRTTQTEKTRTSVLRVEFEPTIPVLERAKKFHALHRAAAVIGIQMIFQVINPDAVIIAGR